MSLIMPQWLLALYLVFCVLEVQNVRQRWQ